MRKPNIIILNPDEMRWDAMGHMGNPAAVTPALDNFAGTDGPAKSNAYWPKKTAQLDPEAHEKSTMILTDIINTCIGLRAGRTADETK